MSDRDLLHVAEYFRIAEQSVDDLELGDLNNAEIDDLKDLQTDLHEWQCLLEARAGGSDE